MQLWSQLDPRWSSVKLGTCPITMGKTGCCVTAVCMVLSKWGSAVTPGEAAQTWNFTDKYLLLWNNDFGVGKFCSRPATYNASDLKEWLKNENNGAVVQVDGHHWLAARYFTGDDLFCHDPWGGVRGYALKGKPRKYQAITGVAYFSKKI